MDWPGRFQVLKRGGAVHILDGAHNPEAIRAFIATFEISPFKDKAAAFVAGFLDDKDHLSILGALAPYAAKIIFTRAPSERAVDPCALADEYSKLRPDADIEVQEDIEAALAAGARAGTVVVLGSFYLVGSVLSILKRRKTGKAAKNSKEHL